MTTVNNKLRDFFLQPTSVYARPLSRRIVLALAFFSLLMIVLSTDFLPDKVSLQVGQVSDRDVVAPRTVSYVNADKTKKLEMEVLSGIASVYDLDGSVGAKAEEKTAAIFRLTRSVAADKGLSAEAKMDRLSSAFPGSLPTAAIAALLRLDDESLKKCEEIVRDVLKATFQKGLRADDLENIRKQVQAQIEEQGLARDVETVVSGIAQAMLQPNFIYNERETQNRRQAALASIEPVRETLKKGQIVVRRGDVVTAEQIHIMEELGLRSGQVNELRIFGLALYVLAVMALILGYLYKFAPQVYSNDLYIVLLGLIILVTLLLGKAAHYYSDFAAPMAAGALLTAILIDARLGILASVALALLFGVIADYDLRAVGVALMGSMTGVYSVTKMTHGYSLTKTGVWVAAVNFIIISATGFVQQVDNTEVLVQGMLGVVGGIASAVITIGMLPYLENTFNIITPLKLLDLAKPNHPLMQRLLMEAPGTYHHSLLVGNLAETAAELVQADPVLARVGAFYHDIGKIKRPYFFIENQVGGENPHDKIAPSLSTLIVTSHIKDGVDLCRDYKLPAVIADIVRQHHGTMLVSYFFKRASENEHSECIIEADFRYEGPKPQTKEAALVMLADACEAAVRSISKPNLNRIETMVRKIIRERLHDGQLDECNLTLKDLNIIGDVYIKVLSSMFHARIEYPEVKDLERRKARNGNCAKQCPGKDEPNFQDGGNSNAGTEKSG